MGQYYRPVVELDNKITVYNRNMGKLIEHSWLENPLMMAISEKLYMKKGRVLWCGDYAKDDEIERCGLTVRYIWDTDCKELKSVNFRINNLYFCNHDTKQYINIDNYIDDSTDSDGWCLHPLSLMTAIGNGRGRGDYLGINEDKIGIWFWDLISFEPKIPEEYKEFEISFIER